MTDSELLINVKVMESKNNNGLVIAFIRRCHRTRVRVNAFLLIPCSTLYRRIGRKLNKLRHNSI